jgi:PTS system mannose-specific IIB component/fructoselysine and glucoselysine-specific PTS system IIB component
MPIALYRIDDRLIHGQVVVGWGTPLCLGFIVLADDSVAESEWEQELYRMGVPPGIEVFFVSIQDAALAHAKYVADKRTGILLTGDAVSMLRLVQLVPEIPTINVGGIHHRADRVQKLRYVFLTASEEETLRQIASYGASVTAQDVPSARPIPLDDVIRGEG